MKQRLSTFCLAIAACTAWNTPLLANTTSFGLLGDPNQNFTFARSDSPVGQLITDPVGPYPGWLGADVPGDLYGFFCIDYLKGANWGASYPGVVYGVGDAIPGKTEEQLVEAGYLSDKLYHLGGSSASTTLYQGPISFAIWQIMDPIPGDVPRDPAAQAFILEAQQAYTSHLVTAATFANTRIFVPNNTSIQDFMTLTGEVPEPGTLALFGCGLALIVGKLRRSLRR
jgi:PEP-CTERM motif